MILQPRFVDDSHACLKRNLVNEFHSHLNSIDPHLQFTIELEENRRLPFLDTITTRSNSQVIVTFTENLHTLINIYTMTPTTQHSINCQF